MPFERTDVSWGRELQQAALKSGEYVEKEIRTEVASLKTAFDALKKKYGNQTPKDLAKAGNMIKAATSLFNFFSALRTRVERMIKRDITKERRLEHLFGKGRRNPDYGANMMRLESIIKKQKRIMAELDAVMKYWEHVKSKGKLPWFGYNKQPIAMPLQHITNAEMALIADIDAEMRAIYETKTVKA